MNKNRYRILKILAILAVSLYIYSLILTFIHYFFGNIGWVSGMIILVTSFTAGFAMSHLICGQKYSQIKKIMTYMLNQRNYMCF